MSKSQYLEKLTISKEEKQKVIKSPRELSRNLKENSEEKFHKEIKQLQNEILITLRIYDDRIWQRVNTKNISTLTKKDELIFNIFDYRTKKLVFTGIGNIIKHNKNNNEMRVKITPLKGEKKYDLDFKYVYNYKPCDKKCKLNLKVFRIDDLSPVNLNKKDKELTTDFFPFVFEFKDDEDFFVVYIYKEFK